MVFYHKVWSLHWLDFGQLLYHSDSKMHHFVTYFYPDSKAAHVDSKYAKISKVVGLVLSWLYVYMCLCPGKMINFG